MSATRRMYECPLCQAIVAGEDRTNHASQEHPGDQRTVRNNRFTTDSRYVMDNWIDVPTARLASGAGAVRLSGLSASNVVGVTSKDLMSAENPTIGAGSTLSATAVGQCFEAIEAKFSYKFDRNSFVLGLARWYANTTGSTQGASAGAIMLWPDTSKGNGSPPKLVTWVSILDALLNYGSTIGMTDLTPRKLILQKDMLDIIIDLFRNHDEFAGERRNGIRVSNDAGIPVQNWYYALAGIPEHLGTSHLDNRTREALKIRRLNARVQAQDEPESSKFDPLFESVGAHAPRKPVLSLADQLRQNIAISGMATELDRSR